MTDPQINVAGMPEFDALLDHIYEYGTASEGIIDRANAFARALLSRYGQAPAASAEPVSDETLLFGMRRLEPHLKDVDAAVPELIATARTLLSRPMYNPVAAQAPQIPAGCILVQEADVVPHVHPQYGPGVFFTEDAKLDAAPAPAANGDALWADPLQGAADWLVEALANPRPTEIAARLLIGYNRASRLYDAAMQRTTGSE